MAATYLFDTNICIYIQRNKPQSVLEHFKTLKPGEAAISIITWGELLSGAEKSSRKNDVLALLNEFAVLVPVLPMPEHAGITYAAIRARLEIQGNPIGNNDLWIASHAKADNLCLVTNNEREFSRIPGLMVENWVR
ncbi:type II toxin-antitoxin system toxin VapC [Desulfatiferula olefinivorans]